MLFLMSDVHFIILGVAANKDFRKKYGKINSSNLLYVLKTWYPGTKFEIKRYGSAPFLDWKQRTPYWKTYRFVPGYNKTPGSCFNNNNCSVLLPSSASTQINSTSTQSKAEVSINSTFSSHPPTRPPTRYSRLSQTFQSLLDQLES